MVANVEHLVCGRTRGRRARRRAHHTFDDIVDVGEVALQGAVAEHRQRLPGQKLLGETEVSHVRPSPWPVNGEEAQPGGAKAVQVAVDVRHQLIGLLGRGVQRHR
jgi:hypothetical protein